MRVRPSSCTALLAFACAFASFLPARAQAPNWPSERLADHALRGTPVLADFDHDGRLDSTAIDTTGTGLVILRGDGFGGFAPIATIPAAGVVRRAAAGDFDADGDPDLAFIVDGPSTLYVATNSAGTFGVPVAIGAAPMAFSFVATNLNGDARTDLAAVAFDGASIAVWLAQAGGGFNALTPIASAPTTRAVAAGDLTNDGVPELVTVANGAPNGVVQVFQFNGTNAYSLIHTHAVPPQADDVALGDVTHDGAVDVAVIPLLQPVQLLAGNGAGGLANAVPIVETTGFRTQPGIELVDVDEDGRIDIVGAGTAKIAVVRANGIGGFDLPVESGVAIDAGGGFAFANIDGVPGLDVISGTGAMFPYCGVSAASGTGGCRFRAPQRFDLTSIKSPTVLDVDGDSDVDVVGLYPTGVGTLINDGAGAFSEHVTAIGGLTSVSFGTAGDLDGDGDVDVTATRTSNNFETWTLTGDGMGGFAHTATLPAPVFGNQSQQSNPHALADLDADGDLDLLGGHIGLLQATNDGTGAFATWTGTGGTVDQIELADADADGDMDVFTLGGTTTGIGWFRNDGAGLPVLVGAYNFGVNLGSPMRLATADVDGDNVLDLVISALSGIANGRIVVFKGLGPFAFAAPTTQIFPLTRFEGLAVEDLNGDGRDDLLAADLLGVREYIASPAGAFVPGSAHAGRPTGACLMTLRDLDGDGDKDLITGDYSYGIWLDGCAGKSGRHGFGCAGANGFVPELAFSGCPSPGMSAALHVDHGLGGSAALLVFGANPAVLPIGASGCSLLVAPLLPVSITLPLGGAPGAPGAGSIVVPVTIPTTVPAFQISMQAFVGDPSAATGYSTTQGVTLVVE